MKKYRSVFPSLVLLAAGLAGLLSFPAEASAGAADGLELCAELIIPSLFPFLVLSGLVSALGLPEMLAAAAEGPMRALFGVSGACCAPLLLGLTGGYPVGAAATAQLVRDGLIAPREGERLLPFVNNTGPAFIIGAAGAGVFSSSACGLLLYLSHIAAAVAVGIIMSRGGEAVSPAPVARREPRGLAAALPGCVRNACAAVINICAFVVFFSVIKELLSRLGALPALILRLSRLTGCELSFSRALLCGILELGGGIGALRGLSASPLNLALASFILGFGGLSVHCQTLSVIDGTGMKCARHFVGRALHGAISALFTFFAALLLGLQ